MQFDPRYQIVLRDVPEHLPRRNGKKVHYATVYRWATKGARGKVLETTMIGGVRYTTLDAIARFTHARFGECVSLEDANRLAEVQRLLDEAGI